MHQKRSGEQNVQKKSMQVISRALQDSASFAALSSLEMQQAETIVRVPGSPERSSGQGNIVSEALLP